MSCCLPFLGLNLTKTLKTVVDGLNDNSGVELKNVNVILEEAAAVGVGVVAEVVDAAGVVAEAVGAVGAGVVAEVVDAAETTKDNIKKEEERLKIKENVRTLVRQVVGSTKI